MVINTPENKTATEKFDEYFQEIIVKYGIKNAEELKKKNLTNDNIENLFDEYNFTIEDKYEFMKFFNKMNEEKLEELKRNAIIGAKAAIIMRNLSHNLGERALKDKDFDEFADFCDVDKSEIKGKDKFQKIFLKDSEKMEGHPLNEIYKKLREQGLSPYEAITNLPWEEEAISRGKTSLPTSNDEVIEGSKMGSTMYCTGRVNTILGILALNEGIDYVNQHFKYVEILRDGLSDIMDEIPVDDRNISDLNEILNYEEPHQMLIFIDDDGNEFEIDPNQIIVDHLSFGTLKINNITRKYEGNVGEVAYQMYFFDYLNSELKKENTNIDKEKTIKRLEAYNKFIGGSETLIKRLIAYAIDLGNEKLEKKYTKELQELGEKYPCIKNKFSYHIAMDTEEELQDFVHEKYGPKFTTEDVFSQYD